MAGFVSMADPAIYMETVTYHPYVSWCQVGLYLLPWDFWAPGSKIPKILVSRNYGPFTSLWLTEKYQSRARPTDNTSFSFHYSPNEKKIERWEEVASVGGQHWQRLIPVFLLQKGCTGLLPSGRGTPGRKLLGRALLGQNLMCGRREAGIRELWSGKLL